MDSTFATTEATSILVLNDDCLLEVFKYLDLLNLSAVADVCRRFRQNARNSFQYSKINKLHLYDIVNDDDAVHQFILKTSKVLRLFGEFITKFFESGSCSRSKHWNEESKAICHRKIFELILQYCSGTLITLGFQGIDIKDEMVPMMRPLLRGLHGLGLTSIRTGESFLRMLPLWSPELRRLQIHLRCEQNGIFEGQILHFDGLHQPFKKLESIALFNAKDLNNNDIEEILKRNPQLKEIRLCRCPNLDPQICRFISNHVSGVESLSLYDIPLKRRTAKHFGQLINLEKLDLSFDKRSTELTNLKYIVSAIHDIAAAHIPLKFLLLHNIDCRRYTNQFVEEVSKLKKLENLGIGNLPGLNEPHIATICKNCTEIREVKIIVSFTPTLAFISDIIQRLDKLEFLYISVNIDFEWNYLNGVFATENISVGIENYKEWVEIVSRRQVKTPLDIRLGNLNKYNKCYTTNMSSRRDFSTDESELFYSNRREYYGNDRRERVRLVINNRWIKCQVIQK